VRERGGGGVVVEPTKEEKREAHVRVRTHSSSGGRVVGDGY
jgi:hypothetical protein